MIDDISILGKWWVGQISCADIELIIQEKKLRMSENIPIPISVDNIDPCGFESLVCRTIDTGGSIDIGFEYDSDVYSPSMSIYHWCEDIFVCPGIDLYPDTLLGSIDSLDEIILGTEIWQDEDISRVLERLSELTRESVTYSMLSKIVISIFSSTTREDERKYQ
jgi:hypothetical protein